MYNVLVYGCGFIGYPANQSVRFGGSDTEENFISNLKSQPNDWYYRTAEITYDYNSLGHRCKDIEDIDLSNYILFAGCSHTEGTGLELEKTYPYRLAEILGCDYYNLGLGGTGIDVMTHNLTLWSKKVANLPKALVILWPDPTRFLTLEKNYLVHTHLISHGNPSATNLIIAGDAMGFFEDRKQINKILISSLYEDCHIIHVCTSNTPEDNLPMLSYSDFARDISHYGIVSHDHLATELSKLIR